MTMSNRGRTFTRRAFLACATLAFAGAGRPKPAGGSIAALAATVRASMKRDRVPGVSVCLLRDGEPVWSAGFGVKHAETKRPVDEATVFEAASLSKTLFAYSVLQLVEANRLNLDAPVTTYGVDRILPDDARSDAITTRMLLSHSSGIPESRSVRPFALQFDPGRGFQYSNTGYAYLQSGVEKVAGMPLAAFMEPRVLEPFGMSASSYVWRSDYDRTAATGHDSQGKPAAKLKPKSGFAAWSLHTTATDFARFVAGLLRPSTTEPGRLAPASLAAALSPQARINDVLSWGYGWGLHENASDSTIWHWGDNPGGFKCFVAASKRTGSGIVILTNGANGLALCRDAVHKAMGYDHPAFSWTPLVEAMKRKP